MKLVPRTPGGVIYVHFTGPEGQRLRISTGTSDESVAQLKALEIMREHLVDKLPEEDRRKHGNLETLGGMLRHAMHTRWKDQRSAKSKRVLVAKLAREIGHWPRGAVTYQRVREYLLAATTKSGQPLSAATKNRYCSAIQTACREEARRDPTYQVPEFPHWAENNIKERYLEEWEEASLLSWIDANTAPADHRMKYFRALMVTLVDTGMRCSEAMEEMKAANVLRDETGLPTAVWLKHGTTKSGKGRTVPLLGRTVHAVEAMLSSPLHGTWDYDVAGKLFRRAVGALGIENVTLHTLRHTCASRMVQEGVDLYLVSIWLGHSGTDVTRRYAHLAPDTLAKARDVMELRRARQPQPEAPSTHHIYPQAEAHPLATGTKNRGFLKLVK